MFNISKEPRVRQQPRSTARLLLLHLHFDGAMKTTMIVTLTQNIILPIWRRTGSRTVSCDSTPDSLMLVHGVQPLPRSTVTICSRPLPGMMPCFPDYFSQMPTFTWTGGEYITDCDKSLVQVQPSVTVESSSNASASHYEIMTASTKVHTCMAWVP